MRTKSRGASRRRILRVAGPPHTEPATVTPLPIAAVQLQQLVAKCSDHLAHTAELARLTARGPELGNAAAYLLDGLRELAPDLRRLRRLLRIAPHLAVVAALLL